MQAPWQRSTAAKDYWLLRLPRLLERKLRWRRLGWGAIFAIVTNHDRGDTKESYLIVDDAPSRLELATQILQKYGVAVDLTYSMRLEYRRFHPGEVEPDEFRDARIELTEYQAHLQSATRHLIECGLVIPIIDTEEWTLWPSATILRERHRCRALLSGDLVPAGQSQQIVSVKNTRTPFSARASVHPAASSDRKQSALDLGRGMDLEQALSILELETDAECVGTFPVLVQATPLNTVSSTSASVPLHWVVQQPQDEEEETQEHTKTFVSLQGAVIRKLSVSSGNARFRQPKEIEPSEDGRRRLETATAAHFGTPVTWESLVQRQAVWASHELESHLGRHQSSGFLASSVGTLDSKMGPHPVPASPRLSQRIALLRCLEVAKAQFDAFSLSPGVYCIPLFRRKGIQESTKVEALKPAHGNHSWDIIPAHVSVVVYGPRLALSSLETEYYEHVTLHPECYTGNGWSHPERRPPTANLVISSAYVDEDDTISFNHTIRPANHRLQYAAAEQYSVTDPQQALRQQILDVFEDRGGALVREADIAAHVQKATGWRDILTTVAELVDARRRLWRMYDSSGQAQLT